MLVVENIHVYIGRMVQAKPINWPKTNKLSTHQLLNDINIHTPNIKIRKKVGSIGNFILSEDTRRWNGFVHFVPHTQTRSIHKSNLSGTRQPRQMWQQPGRLWCVQQANQHFIQYWSWSHPAPPANMKHCFLALLYIYTPHSMNYFLVEFSAL